MALAPFNKPGLDLSHVSIDLEARLRRIEKEIVKKRRSQIQSSDPNATERIQDLFDEPPAINGLTLTASVEKITAKWTDSDIGNFLQYEIHVAKDNGFSDSLQIFTRKDTILTFDEGDTNTEYFFKVRQITQDGLDGKFSNTLSATTGRVKTGHVTDDAITIPNSAQTNGNLTVADQGTDTIQSLTYTSTGDIVQIWVSFKHTSPSNINEFQLDIIRDSTTLNSYLVLTGDNPNDQPPMTFPINDTPSAGAHTYKVDVTVTGGLGDDDEVTFSNRNLFVLEVKK